MSKFWSHCTNALYARAYNEIWSSDSGVTKDSSLLGCYAPSSGKQFRRSVILPPSGSSSPPFDCATLPRNIPNLFTSRRGATPQKTWMLKACMDITEWRHLNILVENRYVSPQNWKPRLGLRLEFINICVCSLCCLRVYFCCYLISIFYLRLILRFLKTILSRLQLS